MERSLYMLGHRITMKNSTGQREAEYHASHTVNFFPPRHESLNFNESKKGMVTNDVNDILPWLPYPKSWNPFYGASVTVYIFSYWLTYENGPLIKFIYTTVHIFSFNWLSYVFLINIYQDACTVDSYYTEQWPLKKLS